MSNENSPVGSVSEASMSPRCVADDERVALEDLDQRVAHGVLLAVLASDGALRGVDRSEEPLEQEQQPAVALDRQRAPKHRRHRVRLATDKGLEQRLVHPDNGVGRRVGARDGNVAPVHRDEPALGPLAATEVEAHAPSHVRRARLVAALRQFVEERFRRVGHGFASYRSSVSTVIRPVRWCVSPAPAQSTTAFTRSSFIGRSGRSTAPQAAYAAFPFIVRSPSIWTTTPGRRATDRLTRQRLSKSASGH